MRRRLEIGGPSNPVYHDMRRRMMLAVCATGLALGACGETLKLDVLPDELWWSGTMADGSRMPLCATNVFVTPGDEQIHWVRPRDKSPDGYLVEGNVTKRK